MKVFPCEDLGIESSLAPGDLLHVVWRPVLQRCVLAGIPGHVAWLGLVDAGLPRVEAVKSL